MYQLNNETKILLDSDVIRHFIKGQQLQILYSLYGDHLAFIDVVKNELFRSRQIINHISNIKPEINKKYLYYFLYSDIIGNQIRLRIKTGTVTTE